MGLLLELKPAHDEAAHAAARVPADTPGLDIGELYATRAKLLEQIVRVNVHAPRPVIEDACQFAWSRLVLHSARIRRETAFAWLVTTAIRQAVRLIQREGRELSLDRVVEQAPEPLERLRTRDPDELIEQRDRLAEIRRLPERQQRLVWLQGLGLSYDEIAEREECTVRTVERQLLRAKRVLKEKEAA